MHWASAGVRPIWHFNNYISLAGEAGVDWVKDESAGTSGYLYKLTLAPQVSLGGRFMSRPVIRAFVTYAHWGDDFVGQVGGLDYRERKQWLDLRRANGSLVVMNGVSRQKNRRRSGC